MMRIDKLIETELHTTRKEMKRLFLAKKVKIDGEVEMNGSRNVDSLIHRIEVDGMYLKTNESYFLLHKPKGAVTAVKDQKRTTVIDLFASADRRPDLYPVGRLDRDTSGLLLITSNGQLGYELLHPEKKVAKTYQVTVNSLLDQEDIAAFKKGITFLDGTVCQPAELHILEAAPAESTALVTIWEGKFHQVKKMFLARGTKVTSLERKTMGPLTLDLRLLPGQYRSLTLSELKKLKEYFK
jgi:16S rRNA pseudouridine516 synthase